MQENFDLGFEDDFKYLRIQGIPAEDLTVFTGHVYLPSDLDADEYKADAILNERIIVKTRESQMFTKVRVDSEVLGRLQFPTETGKLGSLIIGICTPFDNQKYVIASMTRNFETGKLSVDNSFKFFRQNIEDSTFVNMEGHGDSGLFLLNARSKDNVKNRVSFFNKNNLAFLSLYIQGILDIVVEDHFDLTTKNGFCIKIVNYEKDDKETNIKYDKSVGFSYEDEFGTSFKILKNKTEYKDANGNSFVIDNKGKMQVSPKKKFVVAKGEKSEPMLLGTKTKTLLQKLITTLASTTVNGSPLSSAVQLTQLNSELEGLLSKYAFLE